MIKAWALAPFLVFAAAACDDPTTNPWDEPDPTPALPGRSAQTEVDSTVVLDLSDINPGGAAQQLGGLSYTVSGPDHGSIEGAGPVFTYRPTSGYVGDDSVEFTITDGTHTVRVRFTITVSPALNTAPVAVDGSAATNEDQGVAIILAATDVETPVLTYTVVAAPAHGALTGVAPNLTYTPSTHYFGADSFTFQASDGALDSNIATVTITVADVRTCGDGVRGR